MIPQVPRSTPAASASISTSAEPPVRNLVSDYTSFTAPTDLAPYKQQEADIAFNRFVRLVASPSCSSENPSNGALASLLLLLVHCSPETAVVRGPGYVDSADTLLEIMMDIDLSPEKAAGECRMFRYLLTASDGPRYADTRCQRAICQLRLVSGTLRPSSASTACSTCSGRDGAVRPDTLLGLRHAPPGGDETAVWAFLGENRVDVGDPTEASTKTGLAQNLVQLVSAHEAFGTAYGACIVNARHCRCLVLDAENIAVELAPCDGAYGTYGTLPSATATADLVAVPVASFFRNSLLPMLPHAFARRDWRSAVPYLSWIHAAYRTVAHCRVDLPLRRLQRPAHQIPLSTRTDQVSAARAVEAASAELRQGKDLQHFQSKHGLAQDSIGAVHRGRPHGDDEDDQRHAGDGEAAGTDTDLADDLPVGAEAADAWALHEALEALTALGVHIVPVTPATLEALAATGGCSVQPDR